MLNIGFPAIAPIAGSFQWFGIGVWQGRLAGMLFTVAALALLFYVTNRLFGCACAAGALFLAVCLSTLPTVIIGKQALGEAPLLFYFLAGMAFFLNSWRRRPLYLSFTSTLWGLAMATKMHLFPFLSVSLGLAAIRAIRLGDRTGARRIAAVLVGSVGVLGALWQFQQYLLQSKVMDTPGIYLVTAWVPQRSVRIAALAGFAWAGIPTALGIAAFLRTLHRQRLSTGRERLHDTTRFITCMLIVTWLAWYLLLSNGWQRYLFPPVFLGSMFVSSFLQRATAGFDIRATVKRAALFTLLRQRGLANAMAFLALLIVAFGASTNVRAFHANYILEGDDPLHELSAHIRSAVNPNSLVESYDWEVLFTLPCRYHYPPNHVQIDLYRRWFLGLHVPILYDPLAANPEYLVLSEHSRFWRLYDDVLKDGHFRLLYSNRRYSLYRRVRS
jgi:hypothetical protein